jgi:glycosyltransferase involved in cell wall biosynthesis
LGIAPEDFSLSTKPQNAKLRIAFDTGMLNQRYRNQGIYNYARQLLAQFQTLASEATAAGQSVEIVPFIHSKAENDAIFFKQSPGFLPATTSLLRSERFWRLGGAWLATLIENPDLLFCPNFASLQFGPCPVVVTIHDATPVVMPSAPESINRKIRFQLAAAARNSRRVITDSFCSKQDLMRIYGLPDEKISVIYLGYDRGHYNTSAPDEEHAQALLSQHGITRPYILHHGVLQPRKNLKRLVQAYRLMLARNRQIDVDLVLAGPLGWLYSEVLDEVKSDAASRGRVILPGALSDAHLAMLIKKCTLAAIPSLYEGFCLPMVEAMACGTPTVAAATSCLPEISGGVLRYFDPLSVDAIAVCMEEVLDDSTLQRDLSVKGLARAQQLSWRRCGQETLELLVEAAGGRSIDKRELAGASR